MDEEERECERERKRKREREKECERDLNSVMQDELIKIIINLHVTVQ